MSRKGAGNPSNIKSSDCISKNFCAAKKSEVTDPSCYNTVSGVSAPHIKTEFANSNKDNQSHFQAHITPEKKHSGGVFKNIFGKSKLLSNSLNSITNTKDLSKIPIYNPMEGPANVQFLSPNRLSVGPDEFIQLYRQRTLSDSSSFDGSTRQKSLVFNEDSGDFLIDNTCDDMSKFHFLIWKDKAAGTKYFKLLKSSGIEADILFEPNHAFQKFLCDHAVYDLMPQSVKLLTFNTKLSVKKTFFAMVENFVKAGVLWDATRQAIIGMLTITDFMEILLKYYKNQESFEEIENHSIKMWKEQLHERALISLGPEDSLLHGCELLLKEKVHRCLVLDKYSGNPLYILTQKRILRFLYSNMEFMKIPDFMNLSISELKCGTYQNISMISYSTKLLEVLRLFIENRISALPVVDENNKLFNVFSKVDFSNLIPGKLYHNMDMLAEEALHQRRGAFEKAHTCKPTDSLISAIEKIVNVEVHRLIIVDNEMHVVGILSLSDILKCLIITTGKITEG